MTPLETFLSLPAAHDAGCKSGLTSVCSAHPVVIEAGLIDAIEAGQVPCIEATCNQVNQDGGYTGMTPQDFREMVVAIAADCHISPEVILFGGDHLGPNPWRDKPAADAMQKALVMAQDYGAAGFGKIHLDASMSCADDPVPLPPAMIAERAAQLVGAVESGVAQEGHPKPGYIIGTEVPVPGGAAEALDHVVATRPEDATQTIDLHIAAFTAAGLDEVLGRIVALVVQPGVEFGQTEIHPFDRAAAAPLKEWRKTQGKIVFEAHSTDYQTPEALAALVEDGFAILKVGPGLTFALREALYGLDALAGENSYGYEAGALPETMEQLLLAHPERWRPYVTGDADAQKQQRHEGLSDRIRYLWPESAAVAAVNELLAALGENKLPALQVNKHLSELNVDVAMDARSILGAAVRQALAGYNNACGKE